MVPISELLSLIESIKQSLSQGCALVDVQSDVAELEELIKQMDDRGDQLPVRWFINVSGKNVEEKNAKIAEIKKLLGVPEDQDIVLTRDELYRKASEISGVSIAQIIKDGADSEAQSLITCFRDPHAKGRGRKGSADSALDKAFQEIVDQIKTGEYSPSGGVPLTKISMRSGANHNSAKNWAVRRGFDFPMEVEKAIALFG